MQSRAIYRPYCKQLEAQTDKQTKTIAQKVTNQKQTVRCEIKLTI